MDVEPDIINLSIDEVIVDGGDGIDRDALAKSVCRELEQAITSHGISQSLVQSGGAEHIESARSKPGPLPGYVALASQIAGVITGRHVP